MSVKWNQANYLTSPYFKDIDKYLTQNTLPTSKASIKQVGNLNGEAYFVRFLAVNCFWNLRMKGSIVHSRKCDLQYSWIVS